jgi:hypothetical protein
MTGCYFAREVWFRLLRLAKSRAGSRGGLHPLVVVVQENGAQEKVAGVRLGGGSCGMEPLASVFEGISATAASLVDRLGVAADLWCKW